MGKMVLTYEKLFSVMISHPIMDITGDVGHVILTADQPTLRFFRQHDIRYHFQRGILFCYIRVRPGTTQPFFPLATPFGARFLVSLSSSLQHVTDVPAEHGGEQLYHFRINVRAAKATGNLRDATLGSILDREGYFSFQHGDPGQWVRQNAPLKGGFGAIDFVAEGTGANRLFRHTASQTLRYTHGSAEAHDHLFTLQLSS